MKTFMKIIALAVSLVLVAGLFGCKTAPDVPPEAGSRTVIYYAASYVTAEVQAGYKEMIKVYNETQGVTDGVYVQFRENAGAISGLESALRNNYQYDVIQLNDNEYKSLAIQGKNFFVSLDKYLTEEAKTAMGWNDIPANMIDRFRLDTTVSDNGKFMAGTGASLLALPNGSDPQVLYYNKTILKNAGINIVSVPESELAAYNAANNATLVAHGYAEYKEAPFAGAISSKNEAGATVYKVFNECIGMNWEEQRCLARAFQNYEALGMEGIMLLDGGRVLAVTMGSRLAGDTFDIHFEKAREDVDGAYNAVNCEFARFLRMKHPEVKFLNREDDMGLEGLRKAKLSYNPHHLIEKYWAFLPEELYGN